MSNHTLTADSLVIMGHTVKRGVSPRPPFGGGYGKWEWMRQALLKSPIGEWMSVEFPNEEEARKCQSSINNKYTKMRLYEKGLDVRTRVHSSHPDLPSGPWTCFWRTFSKD